MNDEMSLSEFLALPTTVDFIARKSEYFSRYVESNPAIKVAATVADRYIIGYLSEADFQKLRDDLGSTITSSIPFVLGLLDKKSLESAGIIQVQEQPFLDLRGKGVLMGFVDTGIDYTKEVFIYEDGTSKIQYLYDQTASGAPPEDYYVGVEYTNAQINEALKAEDPYSIVPQKDEEGHGTFLASVAAGREVGDFIGAAPGSELIVVKVRPARRFYREMYLIPPEQKNAYGSNAIILGIDYILNRARKLGRPVAICIGMGTNQGGHDGFSIFEEYLSEISSTGGVCVCTAVGNESQAGHHTQGTLSIDGSPQNIDIKVGENAGDVFVSILNGASDRVSVSIKSPTGEKIGRIPAKSQTIYKTKLVLEKATVIVEYYFPKEGSSGQTTIVKILNATPGIWTIVLYGDIILDGTYHAWLPITGFVSPNVEFLAPNPYYTVVVPSTAIGPISIGAYNSVNNSLYPDTSWGPTRLPVMSPDFVSPGVNVGGVYPGGYGTMDGTSVSTAITSGACALMLQWGIIEKNDPSLSTYQIRAFLIRGCIRDKNISYPNNQWGYGKMNLYNSFNLMREQKID